MSGTGPYVPPASNETRLHDEIRALAERMRPEKARVDRRLPFVGGVVDLPMTPSRYEPVPPAAYRDRTDRGPR